MSAVLLIKITYFSLWENYFHTTGQSDR